jgi:formate-dependent nitrite reductase membrane component NrfD
MADQLRTSVELVPASPFTPFGPAMPVLFSLSGCAFFAAASVAIFFSADLSVADIAASGRANVMNKTKPEIVKMKFFLIAVSSHNISLPSAICGGYNPADELIVGKIIYKK